MYSVVTLVNNTALYIGKQLRELAKRVDKFLYKKKKL